MRVAVINNILKNKIIAIVRGVYGEEALSLARALNEGGIKLLEVTFDQKNKETHQKTAATISLLKQKFGDEMCFGAGTVTSVGLVRLAKEAGADYIVSPDTKTDVIKETVALDMVSCPGALTPTEAEIAYGAGADFVKLFPVSSLGPSYIKAVCTPLNHIRFLAVGGVNENNAAEFIKAGAVGVGCGGMLVNKDWIKNGELDIITALAKDFVNGVNV